MSKNTKKQKQPTIQTKPANSVPSPVVPTPPALSKPPVAQPAPIVSAPVKPVAPPTAKPIAPLPAPKPNRVCLEFLQPGARSVAVAGSFNDWKPERTPLSPAGDGRWVGDLAVQPGRHEYLFVVDGRWLPDPNAKESVANPFGGINSVLLVSE